MSRCTWPPRVSTGPSLRAQPETRTLVSRPMGRPCSVQAYAPTFVIVGGAQPEALQSPCIAVSPSLRRKVNESPSEARGRNFVACMACICGGGWGDPPPMEHYSTFRARGRARAPTWPSHYPLIRASALAIEISLPRLSALVILHTSLIIFRSFRYELQEKVEEKAERTRENTLCEQSSREIWPTPISGTL